MKHILQRPLIILLVLLQLVAPLVHAHSGHHDSPEGVHLPGLEFVAGHEIDVVFSSPSSHSHFDGEIISVSSGIKYKKLSSENAEKVYLLTKAKQHNMADCMLQLTCRFEDIVIQHNIYFRPGSPRAPPA